MIDDYIPTIGIECHVQLATITKLFSDSPNDSRQAAPNTNVSAIDFALPGMLPRLNKEAVNLAIKAGLALGSQIVPVSRFDRKHYFYPDLPKGYQITQLFQPIIGAGRIEVPLAETSFTVRINHAHLEEDAGKLTHPEETGRDYSLVDLNRAGTPLIEIVSEADMHSAEQAKAYVRELYLLMKFAGVTRGDLFHGNMRFDVNISAAKKTAKTLGTRAEVKNLNSFRAVEKAVEYEFKRQVDILKKGQKVSQETRGWDDGKQKTFSQRSKAEAQDYRYMPEPDVPPIVLDRTTIEALKKDLPPLPPQLRGQCARLGIDGASADILLMQYALHGGQYISAPLAVGEIIDSQAAQFVAHFLVNRFIKRRNQDATTAMPSPKHFMAVYELFKNNQLSSNSADELLFQVASQKEDCDVPAFAAQAGLLQQNDEAALQALVDEVLANSSAQKSIEDIKAGNDKAIGFLVGQVMKLSRGKANPSLAQKLIRAKIDEL